jgi:hypothetical protein
VTRGIALLAACGAIAGCGITGAASLPTATACTTVLANVTSITNQAAADAVSGPPSRAVHDFVIGAREIRHDVALLNPTDPVAVAADRIAAEVAKAGQNLATDLRRNGSDAMPAIPNIKTTSLTAACPLR